MSLKEITFTVTVQYETLEDGVVCPDSMKENLLSAIEKERTESCLTPSDISANWVEVELAVEPLAADDKSVSPKVDYDLFCERLGLKAYDDGAELGSSLELYESYLETFKSKPNKKEGSCPDCHSEHVDGGAVEIETGQARQKVSCTNCEAEWVDVYKLVARDKI